MYHYLHKVTAIKHRKNNNIGMKNKIVSHHGKEPNERDEE